MTRFLLAVVAIAAIGSLAAPGSAGAQTPAQDSVRGTAAAGDGRQSVDFTFNARSGPSGESPTGTVHFDALLADFGHLEVSCLTVSGNRATMAVRIPPSPNAPAAFVISVEDNGGGAQDEVRWHSVATLPADCPVPSQMDGPIRSGNIVVSDAEGSVSCGQVLTEDTTLEGDLDCTGTQEPTALIIGAPGITLDLGGHTITTWNKGIRNDGHAGVTIRNGTLTTETGAIDLVNATGNVIRNVAARGLLSGITLDNADHNRLIGNDVAGVFFTLRNGSDGNTLRRNVVSGYESGIYLSDSNDNRIVDNVSWTVEDTPLTLNRGHRNTIRGNTLVSGNAYGASLLRLVASNRNDVVDNLVVTYGELPALRGIGIELEGSNRNVLRRNRLSGTPLGVWIRSGNANELRLNEAEGFRLDEFEKAAPTGFLIAAAAQRTSLDRNSASGFEDDGFALYGARTAAGGNIALDNGDFGIDAIAGTIDLGRNRAAGNGGPQQCRNIVCGQP